MELPYPISVELLRVLMIGAISVEYSGKGVWPPPLMSNIRLSWVTHSLVWCRSPCSPFWGGVDVDDDAPGGGPSTNGGSNSGGLCSAGQRRVPEVPEESH
jgi:hypothetical protein